MTYLLIKWLHVLAAIAAVGANMTYGVWIARGARQPAVLPFALRTVKTIDDWIANPAYGVLLVTGFAMTGVGHLPILQMPWLMTALALYLVMGLIAAFGYTPTLKRQIQALDAGGPASASYLALANRGRVLGIVLALLVVAIIFLMVVKPGLWM